MAENIVRTNLRIVDAIDIVDAIHMESNSLRVGLGLFDRVLTFDRSNEAAVSQAQDQMCFIAEALGESQKRLERLAADIAARMRPEKSAA